MECRGGRPKKGYKDKPQGHERKAKATKKWGEKINAMGERKRRENQASQEGKKRSTEEADRQSEAGQSRAGSNRTGRNGRRGKRAVQGASNQ